MSNMGDEGGYGKPPVQTQFVKGRSGNPKGRPKGAKNLSSIFHKATRQLVTVNMNGRTVRITKLEACIHQLVNKAAAGDQKAVREVLCLSRILEALEQTSGPDSSLDERDKSMMAGLLVRIRSGDGNAMLAEPGQETSDRQEEP